MAFSPRPNDYYYLVARHSGKVLGVEGGSNESGARIVQADPADEKHQRFKFQATGLRTFAIRPEHSDHTLDIHGSHLADGAKVIQYPWQGSANQRFRLIDAGEGYYFIEAEHSGKCLDVQYVATAAGSPVVQHQHHHTATAHHQQFRPVLATSDIAMAKLPSFQRPMDYLREATLGGLGFIPTVGGAVKFIAGALWPDQSLQMVWNQITAYIDKLIESKLLEERITALQQALEGARKNLAEYNRLEPGAEKLGFMNSVIATLNAADSAFFRKKDPERTATYLMTMGSLKISLLRERLVNYTEITGTRTDPNAAAHLASLKSAVEEYTTAAMAFRKTLLARRLTFLSGVTRHDASKAQWIDFVVKDAADESEGRAASMHVWRVFPPFRQSEIDVAQAKLLPACQAHVKAVYGAQLDALFASARIWNSAIPGQPEPAKKTIRAVVGPFGGGIAAAVDLTQDKPIAGLRIYFNRRVRGIQARDGSDWGPLVGRAEGTCHELLLKTGERIVSAYGQADGQLAAACFETSFGASLRTSVPTPDARAWHADLAPEVNATLARITASPGEAGVEGITLHWDYEVMGEYPAAVKGAKSTRAGEAAKASRKQAELPKATG